MPIGQELGGFPTAEMTHEELVDHVANLQKTIEYYLGGQIDSTNAREFGGFYIKRTTLASKSGNVGLHSGIGVDPVRLWAGNADMTNAPFRVHDNGRLVATNAEITGNITMTNGNIIWGNVTPPSYAELTGSKPPADANNTYNELLFNSGIRGFVNVGGTLFLSADYIRAGTISGVTINVDTNLTVGNNIRVGVLGGVQPAKEIRFDNSSVIMNQGDFMTISAMRLDLEGSFINFVGASSIDFGDATVSGISGFEAVAKFG